MNVLGCNMTRPNFASGLPTQNVSQKMQFHQAATPSLNDLMTHSPSQNSSRHFQNPNIFNMNVFDKSTPSSYQSPFLNQPECNIDRINTNSPLISSSDSMQVEEVAMEADWESMSVTSNDSSSDESIDIDDFSIKETAKSYESDSDDDFIVFEGDDSEDAQDGISADFQDDSSSDDDDESGNNKTEEKKTLFFCNFKQKNGTSHTGSEETEFCAEENKKKSRSSKKVTFAEGSDLAEVHVMIKWSFAYRKARKGIWEQFARDNERFKLRACRFGDTLNKFLLPQHRQKIYEERFKERYE